MRCPKSRKPAESSGGQDRDAHAEAWRAGIDPLTVSIAPPSDIVLDVAQAADPARVQAAAAKLASLAGANDIDFSAVLGTHVKPVSPAMVQSDAHAPEIARGHAIETRPSSPYQKFEAVLLQNVMQSILPKDADLFGDSFSADAYRSMMAEQLANQVAKTGRLGIARAIEQKEGSRHHDPSSTAGVQQPGNTTAAAAATHILKPLT